MSAPDARGSSLVDARVQSGLALLRECLSDEEPWSEDDLVERMEAVYVALGGDLRECG